MLVQDAHDLAIEQNGCRQCFVRQRAFRPEHQRYDGAEDGADQDGSHQTLLRRRRNDVEGESKRVDFVVAPELGPGTVEARLRHQSFERHVGAASQFFEVGSGRNDEARIAVVVGLGKDIERM